MRSILLLAFALGSMLTNAQVWQWAKNSTGSGIEQGIRIGADGYGNCYSLVSSPSCGSDTTLSFDGFTGSCYGNYFVKHDSLGQVKWVREIKAPTSNVQFYDIKTDYAGNSYVLLNDLYSSPITFDTISVQTPSETVFVAKYDASGHVHWVGTAGNCGGTPTKHQTLGIDAQNNVYIASTEVPGNTLVYDSLILTKLNTNGSFAWRKYVHGTGWYTQSSVTDLNGNTYLVGNLNAGRTADFYGAVITNTTSYAMLFMTKYNSSGQVQWARLLNNDAPMFDPYLCMDSNGNFYITGYFQNSGLTIGGYPILNASAPPYNDVFVVKLDNQATVQWARSAGGGANDAALGIAVDAASDVYITGYYSGNAIFGGLTLTSHFGGLFVARYDGSGNMLGAAQAGGN